jgi:AraC-like DNA-binding protein
VAFRSAFRSITGQSPRKWIERQRIDAVLGMLADPRVPVADAARLAGFDDPFHFARVVRRVTGRPPSSLRRRLDA